MLRVGTCSPYECVGSPVATGGGAEPLQTKLQAPKLKHETL